MKVNAEIIMTTTEDSREVILSSLISAFYKEKGKYLNDDEFLPDDRMVEVKISVKGKEEREVNVEEFIDWLSGEFEILDKKLAILENAFEQVFER